MMAALPETCAGHAEAAAKSPGPGPGRRIRARLDSARGADDRSARTEDRRVDDGDHLQRGGHQRREPAAVRRDLPRQHDGLFLDDPATRPRRRPGAMRCSSSCAAARGWPRFTPRPTRITARPPAGRAAGQPRRRRRQAALAGIQHADRRVSSSSTGSIRRKSPSRSTIPTIRSTRRSPAFINRPVSACRGRFPSSTRSTPSTRIPGRAPTRTC